jgi:hypothetical protein
LRQDQAPRKIEEIIMRSLSIVLLFTAFIADASVHAQAVNPAVFRDAFDKAKGDAEVVADTRVATVVCTEAKGGSITLQVALQVVLAVEKGPLKKNEIVVVSR